ncbi:hypothetical protein ACFQ4O_13215, partial [Methylopila musalis]
TAQLGLSGAEMQRLALRRLAESRPDWAFLDEPTSALDPEAEAEELAALRAALPDTTFVIVAHRRPEGLGDVAELRLDAAPVLRRSA